MANTVESIVRLYGSVSSIVSFQEKHLSADKTEVLFDRVLGKYESSCGAFMFDSCYREGVDAQPYDASLYLYIESRWDVPMDWFHKVIAMHSDITFEISFNSAESLFAGSLEGVDGLVTKCECRSDRELTQEDLFIMGIGECEECDRCSVAVLFGEDCPHCLESLSPTEEGK